MTQKNKEVTRWILSLYELAQVHLKLVRFDCRSYYLSLWKDMNLNHSDMVIFARKYLSLMDGDAQL